MPIYRKDAPDEPLRRPRLPRLGHIRLGYKETRYRNDGSEYTFPRAADHFVLVDALEVAKVYGDEPTVLEPVLFPLDNEDLVASHYLRMYGQTWGLICRGDGLSAGRQVDPEQMAATGEPVPASHNTKHPIMQQVNCPCPYLESGDCKETLYLSVMLPEVPGAGVWQISTGSINSIRNIQGSLAMIRAIAGRINDIPLRLSLEPVKVTSQARGGQVVVHVLQLALVEGMTATQLARGARAKSIGLMAPPEESPPIDEEKMIESEYNDPDAAPVEAWTPKEELQQAPPSAGASIKEKREKIIGYMRQKQFTPVFMQGLILGQYQCRMADLDGPQLDHIWQLMSAPPGNLVVDQTTGEVVKVESGELFYLESGEISTTTASRATEPEPPPEPEPEPPQPSQGFLQRFFGRCRDLGIAPANIEAPKILGTPDEPVTLAHYLVNHTEEQAMERLEEWAKSKTQEQDDQYGLPF